MHWLSWSHSCYRHIAHSLSSQGFRRNRRKYDCGIEQLEQRTLLAANLAPPDINDQSFFVQSTSPNGTLVGTVQATDSETPTAQLTQSTTRQAR